MQLSWQPVFSLSRKPVRRSIARRVRRGQQFEFILEHPVGGEAKDSLSDSASATNSEALVEPFTDSQARHGPHSGSQPLANNHGSHPQVEGINDNETQLETLDNESPLIWSDVYPDLESIDGPHQYPRNSKDQCTALILPESIIDGQQQILKTSTADDGSSNRRLTQDTTFTPAYFPNVSVPPGVLYDSLYHRFEPILERYNREFCKIPLTSDLRVNPFRYRKDCEPEPVFLVHAVMALAGHHVKSTLTQDHRHAALKLLREELSSYIMKKDAYYMLNTIIILFSLDETQSAFGNWNTHLIGAYGLLEACGGIEGWITSARAIAQVAILTWWDAITSLVSRECAVFPYTYPEAVLSKHDGQDWDYFGLCGCPPSLVSIVMRLARLGAEKQRLSLKQYATFDTSVISEIEQSLESWYHISPETTFQSEEDMQQDQDTMHCSAAWRNGLLLYVYRVFRWEPGSSVSLPILLRARSIIDHVFACRDQSMVSRQALLPLFFAGCELRDQSLRRKIIQFCSIWDKRTRYHMFSNTIPLLEEVWAGQDAKGFENVWWGQIVDKQHSSQDCHPLQMRLCFG